MTTITSEQANKLLTACKEMFAEAYRNEYAREGNFTGPLHPEFRLAWNAIHAIEPEWFGRKIEAAQADWNRTKHGPLEHRKHDDLRHFDRDDLPQPEPATERGAEGVVE